ncbi:hypothetical protein PLANTIT3_60998 [Plantibacter sp. T3]|nr:hypothetical protein PLANTIT3_60998 [Plantibacter sp. T3]
MPVGTKTTSSRSKCCATSEAATRCPWWIGSNVPPMTPIRGRRVVVSVTGALTPDSLVAVLAVSGGRLALVGMAVGDVAVAEGHGAEDGEQHEGDRAEHPGRCGEFDGVLRFSQDGGGQDGRGNRHDLSFCATPRDAHTILATTDGCGPNHARATSYS